MITQTSRRSFVKATALAGVGAMVSPSLTFAATGKTAMPPVYIFSKHLQFLDYEKMAEAAARIGFDGVDLTVRPNGHVLPENVKKDLPQAIRAIQAVGLKHELMTTAVDDARDPIDATLLEVAADQGVKRYRMNWYRYSDEGTLEEQLARLAGQVSELADLNAKLGLTGCYQNHAGTLVGASLWETWKLISEADPDHFGLQYDIRHATVEGGLSWPTGLRLALSRIKTIVVKDFKWIEKDGRNQLLNTPVGEGTVDWISYFRTLKENKVNAPISLHLEYELGGAESGNAKLTKAPEQVFEAMSKDLASLQDLWAEA